MDEMKRGRKKRDKNAKKIKSTVTKNQSANPSVSVPLLSQGGYSFFIYLELSAEAQADKQLQLSCERLMPQPGPR